MTEFNLTLTQPESGHLWEALIGLVPHFLWAGVAIGLISLIGPKAIRSALGRLSKVGVPGLELRFHEGLEAAVEAHGKTPAPGDIGRVSRRLMAAANLVRGARILWVDDQPENNRFEARLLRSADARITQARSTTEAIQEAARISFDVVISDIARGNEPEAGLKMCREFLARGVDLPVIFYVGTAQKPVPSEAFGIADRPEELLHLVLDALARRRG